jgi:hypothetical protein
MFQRFSSLVDIAMRMHKKLRTKHAFSVLFALSCNALLYVYRLEHTSRNSCTVILDARSQGAIVSFLYLPLSFTKCHIYNGLLSFHGEKCMLIPRSACLATAVSEPYWGAELRFYSSTSLTLRWTSSSRPCFRWPPCRLQSADDEAMQH